MPKQRGSASRGWGHPPRDGRGENWCPRFMSDLGSMTFSLLIPKHVLRPRLVCAGPSSSAEMHYTKSLTKAGLLCHPGIQWKETQGEWAHVWSVTSLVFTDLVPWENKFIHGIFLLTGHFPSRNNVTFQCKPDSVIYSPTAAMCML